MTIQLQPGDYVRLDGLTKQQIADIAEAFAEAGAGRGVTYVQARDHDAFNIAAEFFGWDKGIGKVNAWFGGYHKTAGTRELTYDQIMGPAWDGEGLPPVGCVCEYDDCENGWVPTRILAHHPDGTCAWHQSVEPDGFVDGKSYSTDTVFAFRPVRSSEDVTVDRMLQGAGLDHDPYNRAVCRDLYRAIRDCKVGGIILEEDA